MSPTKTRRISRPEQRDFLAQLKAAVAEKDVEAAYKGIFQKYYNTTFPSPYGSDGHIEPAQTSLLDDGMRLLLEVKFQLELTRSQERAKIIAQAIYYLKKFELDGRQLPNVIVGGDENQVFTVYAPKLYSYLENDYDWSIAPSTVWRSNEKLYRELLSDPNLNVFVFDVRSSAFDINEVFRSISTLGHQDDTFKKLRVTEANIRKVFDEFVRVVFGGDNWLSSVKKLGAQETVSVFIQSILGNQDTYIVPTKKNILHLAGGKEITINAGNYDAFFSRYDRKYTTTEIDTITAVADQLIEEVRRRFHGDFWTPTIWADRAIEMMGQDLGSDWREKYVVWDPAAGTKNLTRDYRFRRLFSSTIHQSEIDMSRQYNQEACVFQYDFLNDDVDVSPDSDPRDLKMPPELFAALKNNEPLVLYTNPPYGQASNQDKANKTDIANTAVGALMRQNGYGHASAELYTQFIYRVQKLTRDFNLTNVFFFFFNKGFLASPAFEKFSDQLLDQFRYNDGFMINAGEFQGTSSAWGIVFSNFQAKTEPAQRQSEFTFSVEHSGLDGIEQITTHTLRRVTKGDTITNWMSEAKRPSESEVTLINRPRINGGFNLPARTAPPVQMPEDALGFIEMHGSSIQNTDKYVHLNSTSSNDFGHGKTIDPYNFERAAVTFAVRKSILQNASWINDKDIFRKPSVDLQASAEWQGFVYDCVVYSLFHRSSYQTSLRQFDYFGDLYDVYNQWFFMSRADVIELAERHNISDIVYDARSSEERYVYNYLSDKNLSHEAADVLNAGKNLVSETFKKRFIAAQEHPEWHLLSWDAGYLQHYKITTMFKEDFASSMAEFSSPFLRLEAKIRAVVYRDKILEK